MKKVCFVLLLSVCVGSLAHAQQKKDTSILLALPADAPNVAKLKVRLVELALANPALQELDLRQELTKYEANRAKAGLLDMVTAAGNLNEFTINKNGTNTGNNNLLYPRYNFGILVPLGRFVSVPAEVKIAKTNKKIFAKQKEREALEIKAAVLRAYEEYSANKQMLELHLPLLEDAYTNYKTTEAKFSKGETDATVEALNASYRIYNTEMVRKITLERDLRESKLTLEGIIGTTMEEVLMKL